MDQRDKGESTDPRIRRTERAVLAAAKELFEQQGYAATTMGQIAQRADVAERTLFLRFESKAGLLKRVVDDTFRGGRDRDVPSALHEAETRGSTLEQRLEALAEAVSEALVRTGPVFAVAREAEVSEPLIAAAFDAARRQALANSRRAWGRLREDGLLAPGVDVDWVAETTAPLSSADTYLALRTTMGWSREELAAWLVRTWTFFATHPSPPGPPGVRRAGRDRGPSGH